MFASQEGHAEVVDTLLLHGASADLQNKVMSELFILHYLISHLTIIMCFGLEGLCIAVRTVSKFIAHC